MTDPIGRASQLAAASLALCVATQIAYVTLGISGTPIARALWQTEAAAYLALALAGGMIAAQRPLAGTGLLLCGLLNVIQLGIGLTLFDPLGAAGEALAAVFEGVVALAFYLYFAGKAALGVAALAIGAGMRGAAAGGRRTLGTLTGLSGLAALLANLAAMAAGLVLVFPAGASGTAAAALLAAALWARARPES